MQLYSENVASGFTCTTVFQLNIKEFVDLLILNMCKIKYSIFVF